MKSIVLTGGGTAGHCLPHMAIYPYIVNDFDKFYYIGSKNGIEKSIMSKYFTYYSISTAKLKRSVSLDNFFILPKVIKGLREATDLLREINPCVVFSKGGYVSVPVVMASQKLKIPVVAHESDYTLGLANKLTANKCKYVLTSFEAPSKKLKNGIFTGPPIRDFTLNSDLGKASFGFDGKKPIILVVGGSSGSLAINNAIIDLLPNLLKKYDLLHICGSNHVKGLSVNGYKEVGYIDNMDLAYSCADIAVARSGAGCLFELLSLKIPTLFIPLPKKASRGDQIVNAKYFYDKKMCNLLYEEEITQNKLLDQINYTYLNRHLYINNMEKYDNLIGNKNIAEIIKKFA